MVSRSQSELGYAAKITFQEGMEELVDWLSSQVADDRVDGATAELELRGLVA